jgi:hypothetical protein
VFPQSIFRLEGAIIQKFRIPVLAPGPAAFIEVIPTRFIYPTSVQALNGDNYQEAISRQGADVITTKVWWDVD